MASFDLYARKVDLKTPIPQELQGDIVLTNEWQDKNWGEGVWDWTANDNNSQSSSDSSSDSSSIISVSDTGLESE